MAKATKEERMVIFDLDEDCRDHWQYRFIGDLALMAYSFFGKNFITDLMLFPMMLCGWIIDIFVNVY